MVRFPSFASVSRLRRLAPCLALLLACDGSEGSPADEGGVPRDGASAADGSATGDGEESGDGSSQDGAPEGDGRDGSAVDGSDGPPASPYRLVGYLPVWRGLADYAPRLAGSGLTHVMLAFANPESGTAPHLDVPDDELAAFVASAHAEGIAVMISIGGGAQSDAVAPLLAPGQVDTFVADLAGYVEAHALDGVDVDVEGSIPGTADYAPFVRKAADALHARDKQLSAALATWVANDTAVEALQAFDFVNVMSYDHCGPWTGPCDQATYDDAVADLATYANRGVQTDRLVLGVPLYAWCWGSCPAEALTYGELLDAYPGAEQKDWIEENGAQLSYNGDATLTRKVELARGHGGMMVWELGQDVSGEKSRLGMMARGLSGE